MVGDGEVSEVRYVWDYCEVGAWVWYVEVAGYGECKVRVRRQRGVFLVTCTNGVVGRVIVDVGGGGDGLGSKYCWWGL